MIYIIREKATKQQLHEMMGHLHTYVKVAVDVERGILAGGGTMHADCVAFLLQDGSQLEFIWGADWNPYTQEVTFESLINIRPEQNNRSLDLLDRALRSQLEQIIRKLLGDT